LQQKDLLAALELLGALRDELGILRQSGMRAVDLSLLRRYTNDASGLLTGNSALQGHITKFSWSRTTRPKLDALLTRVIAALERLIQRHLDGASAAPVAPYEEGDRRQYRYRHRVEARDRGDRHCQVSQQRS
jgi:hypothetical protein